MVKVSFTIEEVREAAEAIPAGWGWHNLAMVNSDPTMGHKVHHSHAVTLVKAGVIGVVPSSGDPQEHRQGPWYAVTKLGQLVAEVVGLRLVMEDAEGSPCVGCPGTGGDGTCMDHDREQCQPYMAWAHGKTLVSLDVKAFMDLDEDARARVCMEAGLNLPDHLDQLRGKTGWLTVLEPLDRNAELTLKVSHLIQQERDAPAERYGTISEEHKAQFRTGWNEAVKDIRDGEDNTEFAREHLGPWFQSGYTAAFNRWNGSITRYTKLGVEWDCEEPKGPKVKR